jgi:outer membrane protein TolC
VRNGYNPLKNWAWMLVGMTITAVPALASAQLSLRTVVDLAQRNSGAVRLAEADVQKAKAALARTEDAYVPSLTFGSGLPAVPDVGFTGGVPSILSATVQSMVFSLPQSHYIAAARASVQASSLSLKEAREQVALDASTAYIELDTVNRELEAARQQEGFAGRLVGIEQERAEAGIDPLSDLLQARLTAAQFKLKRLHMETRAATLSKQLATLTGLPLASITPDHASIPEIPAVRAGDAEHPTLAVQSAQMLALSKQKVAQGDQLSGFLPQISFGGLYSRNTTLLNDFNAYYYKAIPTNNFSSGFSIEIPLFNLGARAKAKESAADALRATIEAEEAQHQNDLQIAELTGSLREMDTLAEIATLTQQIAQEQLKTVLAQMELGNGSGTGPEAQPQLSPKAEQLARIDERQKFEDALEAGFDLSKARLNLLCALGHMEDWLNELHGK